MKRLFPRRDFRQWADYYADPERRFITGRSKPKWRCQVLGKIWRNSSADELFRQAGVLEHFTTEQIVATAQTFNLAITTSPESKIVLPANKTELRRLLRFLDEDYYESDLSQTRYVSNSKRIAD